MSRARKPAPPPQGDLFGPAPPRPRDETPVAIPMRLVSDGTDAAWHLTPLGVGSDRARFAPRALVTRGEGTKTQFFTMPRWVAVERGWL